MDDDTILQRIEKLSKKELELEESHQGAPLSKKKKARLAEIEIELDQAYDLLRQRRARRSAGEDPDGATLRPEEIVENYLQ